MPRAPQSGNRLRRAAFDPGSRWPRPSHPLGSDARRQRSRSMQIYLPIAEVSVNGLGLLLIGAMVGLLSGHVRRRRRLHPDAAALLHRHPAGGRRRLGRQPDRRLLLLGLPRASARARPSTSGWALVLLAGGLLGSTLGVQIFTRLRDAGPVRAGGQPALRRHARHHRRADADREPARAAPAQRPERRAHAAPPPHLGARPAAQDALPHLQPLRQRHPALRDRRGGRHPRARSWASAAASSWCRR